MGPSGLSEYSPLLLYILRLGRQTLVPALSGTHPDLDHYLDITRGNLLVLAIRSSSLVLLVELVIPT